MNFASPFVVWSMQPRGLATGTLALAGLLATDNPRERRALWVDRSKYTGAKLRVLRAERGVGRRKTKAGGIFTNL